EDGIRDFHVTGVQTCALTILARNGTTVYWSGEQASYEDDRGNKIPVAAIFTLAHELLGHSWFIDRGRERQGAEMIYLGRTSTGRSEEHTSELQSRENLVCRLL